MRQAFCPRMEGSDLHSNQVESEHSSMVAVMVVDDQPPFRRAARAVIGTTEGLEAVGDAESGLEALHDADQFQPDLVFLDVHMPGMDGFETARRLTEAHPECIVVLVSLDALELPALAVTGLSLEFVIGRR
jgi:DNA-binding NarL/FixJ family response regulator